MSLFSLIRPGVARPAEAPVDLPLPPPRAASFGDYLFSDELSAAVNVSLHLGRPLLVTGEPGTGKTALAWGIARQLGLGEVLEFHTKSGSVARDLLYTVDELARFHDASVQDPKARDARHYVQLQALGTAITSTTPRVVLIDEVDKAPREFPNDLLNELDRMEFAIPEMGPDARYGAQCAHVLIITSNSERRLPAPFLRRCVYHHVPFPDGDMLDRIVAMHTGDLGLSAGFRALAVRRFLALRQVQGLAKRPATDELIAWVRVLHGMGVDADALEDGALGDLPGLPALVKSHDDLALLRRGG